MLNIIFIILILASLTAIIFIVARKFPQVSNLDLDSLPQEKVFQRKKNIIVHRVDQSATQFGAKILNFLQPIKKVWLTAQADFRVYAEKIYRLWQHEQVVKKKENIESNNYLKPEKVKELVFQAEEFFKAKDYEQAENLYITAVSLDHKYAPAYRGLGDTYLAKNEVEEARQTYLFLARLEPEDDGVMVKLAELAESQGDLEEAIEYYQKALIINSSFSPRFYHLAELLHKIGQPVVAIEAIEQAVELEPSNPRYLDLLIELAIICGNKEQAINGLNKLRLVNLDNQKLDSFKERIEQMKSKS